MPRSLLKYIANQADEMGLLPVFSQEFEWFNFADSPKELAENNYTSPQPITPGMFGYSLLRPTLYQEYFNDLFDLLAKFNIPLEGLHTETGPGVYEAAIFYDEIVAAATKPRYSNTASRKSPADTGLRQALWPNGINSFRAVEDTFTRASGTRRRKEIFFTLKIQQSR